MKLIKSSLTFDICIVLAALSPDDIPLQEKQYFTTLELKMTETITTPIQVEPVEPSEREETNPDNVQPNQG